MGPAGSAALVERGFPPLGSGAKKERKMPSQSSAGCRLGCQHHRLIHRPENWRVWARGPLWGLAFRDFQRWASPLQQRLKRDGGVCLGRRWGERFPVCCPGQEEKRPSVVPGTGRVLERALRLQERLWLGKMRWPLI